MRYKLRKAPERQFLPPQFFDVVPWKKNFPDAPLVTSSFKEQLKIIKKITPILAWRREGGGGAWSMKTEHAQELINKFFPRSDQNHISMKFANFVSVQC